MNRVWRPPSFYRFYPSQVDDDSAGRRNLCSHFSFLLRQLLHYPPLPPPEGKHVRSNLAKVRGVPWDTNKTHFLRAVGKG